MQKYKMKKFEKKTKTIKTNNQTKTNKKQQKIRGLIQTYRD
jgi:hypothetical protein